ncbi:hypothetical protein M3Y97_01028800 [Aphelenchoides bicaudatus]|nr:hypothetical protein M3Y97_01028800 [Aphelenchoides bicaudatus]
MSTGREDSSDRDIELLRIEVEMLRRQLNRVGMALNTFQDQIPPQIAAELTSIVSSENFCLPRGWTADAQPLDLRTNRNSVQNNQSDFQLPQTIHVPPTHHINVSVLEGPDITNLKPGYYVTYNLCQQCGQAKKPSRSLNCPQCNSKNHYEKVVKRSKNQRKRPKKNKIGKCARCGGLKKVSKVGLCKLCYSRNYYHERKNDVSKHEFCKVCSEAKVLFGEGDLHFSRCRQEQPTRKRQKTVKELLIESRRQEAEVLVDNNNVETGFEMQPNTEIVEDTNNVEMGLEMEPNNEIENDWEQNDELFEMFFWFFLFVMSESSLFKHIRLS